MEWYSQFILITKSLTSEASFRDSTFSLSNSSIICGTRTSYSAQLSGDSIA